MTETTQPAPSTDEQVPATMRAATLSHYGPPEDVVRVAEVAVPTPGPDEVLVRVRAASVNALDWHFTTGLPVFARMTLGLRRPHRTVPGADVAGTVVSVGDRVSRLSIGDDVFGDIPGGGFAEYAAAPADYLVSKPPSITFEQAATLGVAGETALQGLRDWGALRPGERVLVNGASGGVGSFAVQVAKALGAAHVTAVCSTANVETAARCGADEVIDYTEADAVRQLAGTTYDVLFDNAGTWPLRSCSRLLAEGGRYVMITSPKSRWLRPLPRMIANPLFFAVAHGSTAAFKVAVRNSGDLEQLAAWAAEGRVVPVMDRRWSLAEAGEAIRVQGEFHSRGKSVVLP